MAQKANMIGKYTAENGNAAAIKKYKASHEITESTVPLFKKIYHQIMQWVWSNVPHTCTKCNY